MPYSQVKERENTSLGALPSESYLFLKCQSAFYFKHSNPVNNFRIEKRFFDKKNLESPIPALLQKQPSTELVFENEAFAA